MELPLGLEIIDLVTILVGLAAFFSFVAVWMAAVERNPLKGRVQSLKDRKDELRSGLVSSKKRQSTVQSVDSMSLVRWVVKKFKLLQDQQVKKHTKALAAAGYRSKDAIVIFMFARLIGPLVGAALGFLLVYGMNMAADNPLMRMTLLFGSVGLGVFGPNIFLKNASQKRGDAIRKSLPDALDLMVICAEAGLTLDATFTRVAKELGHGSPELADELSLTSVELGFMPERRLALQGLADRVDQRAMRSVVATLMQTEKYGTPLAQSLRVLSAEFRNERLMKAEEKAARLPAIMTVPLILFILPTLFIVLLGPATCSVADNLIGNF